jgi:hypothetical protein
VARRVILHVGAPKTGTSYLETIMWGQQDQLEADGVWLPGRRRLAHDALMGEVRGGVWRHENPRWTWEKVGQAARDRSDTVLVSKEMLSGATAEATRIALDPLEGQEVHVVVTARQLAGALPSAWQQLVKARGKISFGDWLSALRDNPHHSYWHHHDPVSILKRWAPGLPAAQVHVIMMPVASDPTELWKRFASVIGVDPAAYKTPERTPNESFGAIEVEMLRRVNLGLGEQLPMRGPYLKNVRDSFTRPVLLGTQREKRKFGVGPDYADWLNERASQTIRELQALDCTIVGDLEELRPKLDPTLPSPDDVTDAEIAELATQALADLLVMRAEEKSGA